MARHVDLNSPLTEEDVQYLISRGREHQLHANFRRFGPPGDHHEPAEGEEAGKVPGSTFYDQEVRGTAVYDIGGGHLPGSTLDYNTGRAFDRENGVTVEPALAGHTPGSYASRYDFREGIDEDGSDIDEDIADHVTSLSATDLEKELKEHGLGVPEKKDASGLSVEQLVEELHDREVQTAKEDKKADLQKKLKAALDKERIEHMQDSLAIHLQDSRVNQIVPVGGTPPVPHVGPLEDEGLLELGESDDENE